MVSWVVLSLGGHQSRGRRRHPYTKLLTALFLNGVSLSDPMVGTA